MTGSEIEKMKRDDHEEPLTTAFPVCHTKPVPHTIITRVLHDTHVNAMCLPMVQRLGVKLMRVAVNRLAYQT